MPSALITGITGQDGSYLAELLLGKGYTVHGIVRPGSDPRLPCGAGSVNFHPAALTDAAALEGAMHAANPDEIYHLAGQTDVAASLGDPVASVDVNGLGTLRILECLRRIPEPRRPRFFHASSCQIFGSTASGRQNESTELRPTNPYGMAKALGTMAVRLYRANHGLFAVNGILFNHESPRRPARFVTARICRGAALIRLGLERELVLRNTTGQRDWGDAREFVEGFWRSLQHSVPDDYVFATGVLHRVQDVVEAAFEALELDWRKFVRVDPGRGFPGDPEAMAGDPSKAAQVLGWIHRRPFRELIAEMAMATWEALKRDSAVCRT